MPNFQLETLLFIAARPVPFKKIAEVLGIAKEKAVEDAKELQEEYKRDGRGFRIIADGKEAEMVSSPENKDIAETMRKGELQEELSQAALEVLAIVLSKGLISKSDIEEIRGVNCSFTIRNLLMRGLIEKTGKSGEEMYKISLGLLKKLGMEK